MPRGLMRSPSHLPTCYTSSVASVTPVTAVDDCILCEMGNSERVGTMFVFNTKASTALTTRPDTEQRLSKLLGDQWVKPMGPSTLTCPGDLGRHQWGRQTGVWPWRIHASETVPQRGEGALLGRTVLQRQTGDMACPYRDGTVTAG